MTPVRLPGSRRLRHVGRWLRSRFRRHIVILGYHRVSDSPLDPLDLAVSSAQLDEHLAFLARQARPVTLAQALGELARGAIQERTVVVTFDDGYEDTVALALPLLRRHAVPATIFVCTGSPGEPFWWDRLAAIVLHAARLPEPLLMEIGSRRHRLTTNDRARLVEELARLLRPLDAEARNRIVARLAEHASPLTASIPRALHHAEIAILAQEPLVEVGGHSMTHPLLAALPAADQRSEIVENRRVLEAIVAAQPRFFSFPHGSFSAVTVDILREAGFAAACCSIPDVTLAGADPFTLPRLWVDGGRKRRFPQWISRWLA